MVVVVSPIAVSDSPMVVVVRLIVVSLIAVSLIAALVSLIAVSLIVVVVSLIVVPLIAVSDSLIVVAVSLIVVLDLLLVVVVSLTYVSALPPHPRVVVSLILVSDSRAHLSGVQLTKNSGIGLQSWRSAAHRLKAYGLGCPLSILSPKATANGSSQHRRRS